MKNKIFQKIGWSVLLITAFFAFSTDASAQSKKDRKIAKQLVEQGDKLFNQKNYSKALEFYNKAVVLVPNDGYSHFQKGFAHFNLNEADLALAEFDLALSQKYRPLEVYKVRWAINYEQKHYDAALNDVNQILKAEPNNTDYLVAIAGIYLGKGAFPEALAAYQMAAQKFPDNGDLYYNIALIQQNMGNTEGQASAATEAVNKRTRNLGEAYYLLGESLQKQKKNSEAIDAYQRAVSAKPDQFPVYKNLADLYAASGRIDQAIEISKRGLVLYTNNGDIYTDLSWFYSLSDRHNDAAQAALAGIRFADDKRMAYTNLCRAYNDMRKPELAISACNSALKLSPDDGETFFYLGVANTLMGKESEASGYYKRAIDGLITFTANNPDYSDGFYLLGNAYGRANKGEKAIEAYRKCLELNPRFVKARFNIGIISLVQGNKNSALEQYNSLLNLDKTMAEKLKAEIDKL